ncbi:MAG: hypothetical protein HC881_20850, partial [Leptolyngbyaceae cyanobacterium SL_7_1]|nr:hypothetical protein [Leptolyngbyaceae cyanobacterium SL_7_1]
LQPGDSGWVEELHLATRLTTAAIPPDQQRQCTSPPVSPPVPAPTAPAQLSYYPMLPIAGTH